MGIRGGRIEVRNILSLMSLIFLFGCSTELDRCIEANIELNNSIPEKDKEHILYVCSINLQIEGSIPESPESCAKREIARIEANFIQRAKDDARKICNSQGVY